MDRSDYVYMAEYRAEFDFITSMLAWEYRRTILAFKDIYMFLSSGIVLGALMEFPMPEWEFRDLISISDREYRNSWAHIVSPYKQVHYSKHSTT